MKRILMCLFLFGCVENPTQEQEVEIDNNIIVYEEKEPEIDNNIIVYEEKEPEIDNNIIVYEEKEPEAEKPKKVESSPLEKSIYRKYAAPYVDPLHSTKKSINPLYDYGF